jgi:hypothetical protein
MNFIKKRLFLIGCVAAFLAGVGFFVPAMMINADNLKDFNGIKAEYDKVNNTMSRNAVHNNVLAKLRENRDRIREDAKKVILLAQQTSNRSLIYQKVFPKPWEASSKIIYYRIFADTYYKLIDSFIGEYLGGGPRPSPAEEDNIREEYRKTSVDGGRGTGGAFSMGASRTRVAETPEAILIDELRRDRAGQIKIYVGPDSFCCYDYWKNHDGTGDAKALLMDSWFTQIAAWIEEDVVLSINQVNREASVLKNPVKRLIEISFSGGPATPSGDRGTTGAARTGTSSRQQESLVGRREQNSESYLPDYVIRKSSSGSRDETEVLTGNMTTSMTERASNELIDVVHFELAVIVDTVAVIDFINALQSLKHDRQDPDRHKRNQISVLEYVLEPIDVEQEIAAGYHYGPASLGVMRIVCEYFFFKSGYEKYKPEPVKDLLRQDEETTETRRGRR